jgi:hypothetical protein
MVIYSFNALAVIGFISLNANESAIGIHASYGCCAATATII